MAVVDDDVIMASELRERLASVNQSLQARGGEMPPEDVLIRETLDRLILESIQMQMARNAGVRLSDAQLNAAVQRIAAQNRMSPEQFAAAIEAEGGSYADMLENIGREMIIQRVQSGNVNQRIQISEQEVDNFLASEEGRVLTQEDYRLIHALLAVSPTATPGEVADAQAYVNGMSERIKSGEGFEEVVSSATGKYTFSGGDLGWRKRADLPSLFANVAPDMSVGQTSEPIRSASGFHLIHLQDKRGGSQSVNQTRARHILVTPTEILDEQQAEGLVASLKSRVESGEAFADLAREYSEDIGSAQEGGDLGWISPGQMVPEFENMMDSTEVGMVSTPVRSQFGWHILQVDERRVEDVTELMVRGKAKEYLHKRKYQEELDAWLRRIRDEAFVDIK
ncbi:MAG: peptidylprolyl isomerase [Pseudomonadota bacterium]